MTKKSKAIIIVSWPHLPAISELKLPFDVTVYVYGDLTNIEEDRAARRIARKYGVLREVHQYGIVLIIRHADYVMIVPGFDAIVEVVHRCFVEQEMMLND